jgi:hypothetical protein
MSLADSMPLVADGSFNFVEVAQGSAHGSMESKRFGSLPVMY